MGSPRTGHTVGQAGGREPTQVLGTAEVTQLEDARLWVKEQVLEYEYLTLVMITCLSTSIRVEGLEIGG